MRKFSDRPTYLLQDGRGWAITKITKESEVWTFYLDNRPMESIEVELPKARGAALAARRAGGGRARRK